MLHNEQSFAVHFLLKLFFFQCTGRRNKTPAASFITCLPLLAGTQMLMELDVSHSNVDATCVILCRARGEALVALKEIPLSDMSVFGATDAERSAGLGRLNKEVEILSSLDHPNIVQASEEQGLVSEADQRLHGGEKDTPARNRVLVMSQYHFHYESPFVRAETSPL